MLKTILQAIFIFSLSGCAAIGNFFIPPHPNSDGNDQERVCLYLDKPELLTPDGDAKALVGVAAVGVTAIAGLLIDRVAEGIEQESSRYKSSYSARNLDNLYKKEQNQVLRKFTELNLVRFEGQKIVKDTCNDLRGKSKEDLKRLDLVKSLELTIEITKHSITSAYELKPTKLRLKKTKAKVSDTRWYLPWTWWMYLDKSTGKIDMIATVSISIVVKAKEVAKTQDIIKVDLPLLKKASLDENFENFEIKDISSGWFMLPDADFSATQSVPVTVNVTITESDDIGDTIGKVAKKVSENKETVVNFIHKEFKIEKDESSKGKPLAPQGSTRKATPKSSGQK
ncbi:MAG: hypothetical protein IIA63_07585 [Nitrospinae bacterium]|nr:hypothetical protein [Nitrospinota bacterium]